MTTEGARAGLYERVSTGIQDVELSRSIERQNREGQQATTQHGWRVVGRYADPAVSASRFAKKSRAEWARLLADISAGRIDIVVMWEPSRGDRKLASWAGFLDTCRERTVRVYITQDRRLYDLSLTRDWKDLADAGVDSAHESNKTSDRTRDGVADSAARGDPHGRVPYGYMRRYELDPSAHKGRRVIQIPNPETAPVAAEIISRIADSEPISAIVLDLAARHIPSPTGQERWSRGTICRLVLEGVVYIGKRRHNGGSPIPGNWPPIVDEKTYWRAVAVLSDPARKPRGGGIRPGRVRYLCSYITTCAVCNGPLSMRHLPRANSQQVAYYRCVRKGCTSAPVGWLDQLVTLAVVRVCSQPELFSEIMAGDDQAAQAIRDEATAEQARLATFEQQAIAGHISPESFARVAQGIAARVAELEQRAQELSTLPELRSLLAVDGHTDRQEAVYQQWLGMPVAGQRRVVGALFRPQLRPAAPGEDMRSEWRVSLRPTYLQQADAVE